MHSQAKLGLLTLIPGETARPALALAMPREPSGRARQGRRQPGIGTLDLTVHQERYNPLKLRDQPQEA